MTIDISNLSTKLPSDVRSAVSALAAYIASRNVPGVDAKPSVSKVSEVIAALNDVAA